MRVYANMKRLQTVLTNGVDTMPVMCSRFSAGIDPPPGMAFTILNGVYFINGRPAWFQIEEVD